MGNNSFLSSTKIQMFLLFLVGGFLFVLSWIFWGMPAAGLNSVANSATNSELTPVNYVMAKIQAAMSLFSLEGREVNRKYLSLDDQQLGGSSAPRSEKSGRRDQGVDIVKSTQTTKAKTSTTDKKSSAAVQAKTSVKTAPSKTIRDIEAERKKRLAEWDEYNQKMKDYQEKKARQQASKNIADQQNLQHYQNSQNTTLSVQAPPSDESKKPKKSIEEWKHDLAAANSPEAARAVIVKFVTAYKNKEVEEIEFYMVVQGYLKSADDNQKGLGLYALRGTPSYASYLLLVKQQAEFSSTLQKYIQDTLLSYHHGGLGTLQQALASRDNQVMAKTMEILKIGLTSIKNGSNEGLVDPRYRRDSDFVTFSAKNYLGFSKILEQLGQSGEGQIKSSALELIALINSSQTNQQPVVASTP